MAEQTENCVWYAMRVTYSRELQVQRELDGRGVKSYIPMREVERLVAGRKRKVRVPVIHNLLFIHITTACMRELKAHTALPICYIMDRAAKAPVIVPDEQMENFMRVAEADAKAEILAAQEAGLLQGDRVRVTEGPFAGVEGRYIRHKGKHKVAVEIRGVATVLTTCVAARSVERIKVPAEGAHKSAAPRAASAN